MILPRAINYRVWCDVLCLTQSKHPGAVSLGWLQAIKAFEEAVSTMQVGGELCQGSELGSYDDALSCIHVMKQLLRQSQV